MSSDRVCMVEWTRQTSFNEVLCRHFCVCALSGPITIIKQDQWAVGQNSLKLRGGRREGFEGKLMSKFARFALDNVVIKFEGQNPWNYMCVCVFVCMHICACLCVCMCGCVHECACMHSCVCACVCTLCNCLSCQKVYQLTVPVVWFIVHSKSRSCLLVDPGHEVLSQLQRSVVSPSGISGRSSEEEPIPTLDMLESQKQVKRVVHYLEQRMDSLRVSLDQRDKTLNLTFQFKDWKHNVKTVSSDITHIYLLH